MMCFKTERDRDQVVAILRTHAEMQDRESVHLSEQSGLVTDPDDLAEIKEDIEELEQDRDNLKRLADEVNLMPLRN